MDVTDRGPAILAVTTATLVLTSVFVGARVVCRFRIVRLVTWDDWAIMLAWLFAFFLSFTINLGVTNGIGRIDAEISEANWPILRRCEYVFSILYNPALMATKTSILIFYLRIAKHTQTVLRYASWATLLVVNISGLVLTIMNIFQCSPVQASWSIDVYEDAACIPLLTEFICGAPINIITDLTILALPIPVLTTMRLPPLQKKILVLTFAVGVFVTIVAVVRVYYLQTAITDSPTDSVTGHKPVFGGQHDFAWNASFSLMWSAIEVNIGMACACVPTLKPLILKLLPVMLLGSKGNRISGGSVDWTASELSSSRNQASVTKPATAAVDPGFIRPDIKARAIDSMESPTTSDMLALGVSSQLPGLGPRTSPGVSTAATAEDGTYFGFVNMARSKSMLSVSAAESVRYCTIVIILFLLCGLSYGLLSNLNDAIVSAESMPTARNLGLMGAYFGGFLFGPLLVGKWFLRRDEHNLSKRHEGGEAEHVGGFKATFIVGLCVYGIGTIIFWPSAVANSYGGYIFSNVIVGLGRSVLEVGSNSFMVLCGPAEYGEMRLLLAQGFQGVGSLVSAIVAQRVFFKGITGVDLVYSTNFTFILVKWSYLGTTLLCAALALFFFYSPLPEMSSDELEEQENNRPIDGKKKTIAGLQLRTVCLILAICAHSIYDGAQEGNSFFFRRLLPSVLPHNSGGLSKDVKPEEMALSVPEYALVGRGAFCASRFLVAYLTYLSASNPRLPRPRTYLAASVILGFVSALVCVVLKTSDPNLLAIPVMILFFAEGPIWPLIFALGLRGQGSRTKRAAAIMTMFVSGASVFPFVMYGIISAGGSVQTAFIVLVALYAATMVYPAFLALCSDAQRLVDARPSVCHALRDDGLAPLEAGASRDHYSWPGEKTE